MTFNQFPFIRHDPLCVNCKETKSDGTLLCWPCHNAQKERNHGDYSKRVKSKLEARELELAAR